VPVELAHQISPRDSRSDEAFAVVREGVDQSAARSLSTRM
jgi:hypothetical protein